MVDRIIQFIFFGNIFVGILAVALSVETVVQLGLPYNPLAYYLLLFFSTMAYYTYAYVGSTLHTAYVNPRTIWYSKYRRFVHWNLRGSVCISLLLACYLLLIHFSQLDQLAWEYWLLLGVVGIVGILYYGMLPKAFSKWNARNTGLLKSLVIGLVWASCVNIFPLIMLKIQGQTTLADPLLIVWLFIKTAMFCTVNAIIFDIKDYAEDANKQLKTFVVRFGLRNTIFQILIPLLLMGALSMVLFGYYRHFHLVPLLINLLPFVASLGVAYSMHRRHRILYYLIVIDGLLLMKALCGMIAMQFI